MSQPPNREAGWHATAGRCEARRATRQDRCEAGWEAVAKRKRHGDWERFLSKVGSPALVAETLRRDRLVLVAGLMERLSTGAVPRNPLSWSDLDT